MRGDIDSVYPGFIFFFVFLIIPHCFDNDESTKSFKR
jgi:hypothetical protein